MLSSGAMKEQRYDVVMDTHGNAPYARVKNSLKPGGRFLMVVGDLFQTVPALIAALRQEPPTVRSPEIKGRNRQGADRG